MTVKTEIIKEVAQLVDDRHLQKLLRIVKEFKEAESTARNKGNIDDVMRYFGSISEQEADDLMRITNSEFNHIEGDW